jgi:hypothetical protein
MSAKKTNARKPAAKKVAPKASYVTGIADEKRITFVAPQPRREGTKAFKLYAAMAKFVGKKKVDVATLLSETDYRRIDLNWDVAHGFVKVA